MWSSLWPGCSPRARLQPSTFASGAVSATMGSYQPQPGPTCYEAQLPRVHRLRGGGRRRLRGGGRRGFGGGGGRLGGGGGGGSRSRGWLGRGGGRGRQRGRGVGRLSGGRGGGGWLGRCGGRRSQRGRGGGWLSGGGGGGRGGGGCRGGGRLGERARSASVEVCVAAVGRRDRVRADLERAGREDGLARVVQGAGAEGAAAVLEGDRAGRGARAGALRRHRRGERHRLPGDRRVGRGADQRGGGGLLHRLGERARSATAEPLVASLHGGVPV